MKPENCAKRLRRYLLALTPAIALCLASCSTPKQTLKTEVQKEASSSTTRHTDSVSVVKAFAVVKDSLISEGETELEVVIYDTEKPAVDSTGLSPVKAVIHKTSKAKRQEAKIEQTSVVDTVSTVKVQEESVKEQSHTELKAEKKKRRGSALWAMAVIAVAIAAGGYLVKKRLNRN